MKLYIDKNELYSVIHESLKHNFITKELNDVINNVIERYVFLYKSNEYSIETTKKYMYKNISTKLLSHIQHSILKNKDNGDYFYKIICRLAYDSLGTEHIKTEMIKERFAQNRP